MSKNTGTSELINYFDLYSLGAIGVAGIIYANDGVQVPQVGAGAPTNLKNVSGAGIVSFGSNFLGFNGNNNLYFSGNSKGYCEFAFNNPGGGRTYTFPSSSGTVALVGGSGVGTVTSVAALTLGTTGTDLSSTVATGTTTPVITLNVPTASASNRGVLSSADWTTFNNKQSTITNPVTGTGAAGQVAYWSSGSAITGESNLFWDATNDRLGIGSSATPTPVAGVSFPLLVTSAAATRIRIDSTQATPNAGVGLYANGVQKFSFAMFGTTSDFTIYNDALLSASLLVKGDTNNLLVGVSAADNGARLQVGGTTTLYATFDSTSVIGAAISLRRSGVSIGAIGNSGVMGVGILDDFEMRSGIGKGLHLKTDGGSLSITTGGAATFSSSVTVGGYLTGQGTNPGGLGASRYVVDFSGGYSRFFSYGANTSTNGGILFNTQRSDGTNSIDALTIAPSGAATFSSTLQATHIGINNAPTLARLFATQTTDGEWVATFKNYGGSASYGVSIDMSGSTSNQSAFQVYTSTGNGLRLINNSRLLIGTFTDSGYQLDVNGTGRFSGTLRSNDHEIKNSANAETLDLFLSPSTFNGFIDYPSSRSLTIRNKGSLSTFTLASTGVATFSNSVGIGVSPLTRLHLQDGAPNYILLTNTAADGVVNAIQGGIIGQARGYGNNLAQMASILFRNDPISWFKGVITFSTNPTDGTDPSIAPTERMRITSEGKVLIGTDTSGSGNLIVSDNNNSGLTLRRGTTADRLLLFIGASSPYIVDDPYIQSNNADIHIRAGSTGGVKLSIGATSFVSDSDIRLKNKISDIDNALESILKLETLKFNWKYDSELENKKAYFGLSAQNVQEILPELIDVGRDDMQTLGVKYTELIPVLVKAIQELNEKLDKNNIN